MKTLRSNPARVLCALLALGGACVGCGETNDTPDSGTPREDAGTPLECEAGQHRCGAGCIDDLANEPANGCRLGCGEPCPTPPDGEASCDEDGACVVACPPPFRLEGGECVCTPMDCTALGAMFSLPRSCS